MKAVFVLCFLATAYGMPMTIPAYHEVQLPAEVAPLVQIIVNVQKKDQEKVPVGTFPLFPVEPEVLPPVGTFPLFPVEPEVLPPVGTFPLFPVEPEVLPPVGTFPLFPVEPEVLPPVGTFPLFPVAPETKPLPKPMPVPETFPVHNVDLLRPNGQGQNIELIQPGTIF